METCNCIEPQWPADELLMKYQYISDFFIAVAYFSIPLELDLLCQEIGGVSIPMGSCSVWGFHCLVWRDASY
ncbi:hypothetical protein M0R45_005406 [Rubus argutus]|uniref:Ethylene receptor n=1 Tax=Rubus argutus TaxID=59490 RepID=A0AAW1YMK7_RUBAR